MNFAGMPAENLYISSNDSRHYFDNKALANKPCKVNKLGSICLPDHVQGCDIVIPLRFKFVLLAETSALIGGV